MVKLPLSQWIQQGRWADVQRHLDAWLPSQADPEALRLLGIACTRQRRHAEALRILDRAQRLAPGSPAIETNRGSVLRQLGQLAAAQSCFERAAALDLRLAAPCFNLGKMLASQACLGLARAPLSEAVRREPGHVEAWIALAEVEKGLGAIAAAIAAFRAAIRLRPHAGAAWWGLANLKTVTFDTHDLDCLERSWADPSLQLPDRILLAFARAHACADLRDSRAAFGALLDANRLKRSTVNWDAEVHSRHVDALIGAWRAPLATAGTQGHECIFIVGLPRSGSTLIEQVLSAHASIAGASELPDLDGVLGKASASGMDVSPVGLATASDQRLLALGREYLARTQRWRERQPIAVDKTPANFLHVGPILRMLPAARIIDCRRDARDTAYSCLMQHFAGFAPWSNDLAEIRRYYRDYVRLMDHWQALAPGRVVQVRYEDFVGNPEDQIRALLDRLGLSFDAACLAPHRVVREVRTASAAQVVEPMDQRGRGRWERYGEHFVGWTAEG